MLDRCMSKGGVRANRAPCHRKLLDLHATPDPARKRKKGNRGQRSRKGRSENRKRRVAP